MQEFFVACKRDGFSFHVSNERRVVVIVIMQLQLRVELVRVQDVESNLTVFAIGVHIDDLHRNLQREREKGRQIEGSEVMAGQTHATGSIADRQFSLSQLRPVKSAVRIPT